MDQSHPHRRPARRSGLPASSRSEAVSEILGTPPNLLIRYGNLGLLVVAIIGLFFVSRLTYPDIVEAPLTLTTVNPAERLYAPRGGIIEKVLVKSGDTVATGTVVMVFRSLAEFDHVLYLEDKLMEVRQANDSLLAALDIPNSLELGSIQEYLYAFEEQRDAYVMSRDRRLSGLSTKELRQRIAQQERALRSEKDQRVVLERELSIASRELKSQQNLLANGLIDEQKVREAERNELRARRLLRSCQSRIRDFGFNIELLRNQIANYQTNAANQEEVKTKDLWESYTLLARALENWKQENLLTSAQGGEIVVDIDVREQKRFAEDDILATLLPLNPGGIQGRIDLPAKGAGKVAVGHSVNIKFINFPYEEFGSVKGIVHEKSPIASGETTPILVALPNGMVTNTGNQLEPVPFMRGKAEIIVGNKRFFSWLLGRD